MTAALIKEPSFWDGMFNLIASGMSLMEVCRAKDLPYNTIIHHISSPKYSDCYNQAGKARALMHAERIEGLTDGIEKGETPSDAGRVAIQARQWLASLQKPSEQYCHFLTPPET